MVAAAFVTWAPWNSFHVADKTVPNYDWCLNADEGIWRKSGMFEFELLTKRDWAQFAVFAVVGSLLVGSWLYWLAMIS